MFTRKVHAVVAGEPGTWDATYCPDLFPDSIVLANFRVVPLRDAQITSRETAADAGHLHAYPGTPVVLDSGDEGTIVHVLGTTVLVELRTGAWQEVHVDAVHYLMGGGDTVDDLARLVEAKGHRVAEHAGMRYLVPAGEPPEAPPPPAVASPLQVIEVVAPPVAAPPRAAAPVVATLVPPPWMPPFATFVKHNYKQYATTAAGKGDTMRTMAAAWRALPRAERAKYVGQANYAGRAKYAGQAKCAAGGVAKAAPKKARRETARSAEAYVAKVSPAARLMSGAVALAAQFTGDETADVALMRNPANRAGYMFVTCDPRPKTPKPYRAHVDMTETRGQRNRYVSMCYETADEAAYDSMCFIRDWHAKEQRAA